NQVKCSPPVSPGAAAPPQESTPPEKASGKLSSDAPSFDERRRCATKPISSAHPSVNVWKHYTAKVAKEDVGYHRPTMEQFVSVLALVLTDDPVATGRELFEAFESAVPTSNRPIVAYMHVDIRFFSNQVDKDYLVIHIIWHSTPVYFHNVYAPVEDDQRAAFFKSLPVDFGDDDTGIHVVGGDFKLPMTTSLGATIPPSNYNAGKADCLAWLAALCVTDAWRL
ncbi:unnamed protein product, partial [Aphanomyces euteiches]